ncbi:PLP-dependent aminotransferase family protein [Alcaligenaceae bacterium]|nr:PLP-dependent aminotransferase family protein [Alcaligenaceae bacterium]
MSRINHIVSTIATRIESGQLSTGTRLLSVRAAAAEYGVSKNTVADAYDRLVGMGHLEARPGSGYYVAVTRYASSPQRSRDVAQAIDTVSLLREQLVQHYNVRVGDGRPPAAWMEKFDLNRAASLPDIDDGITQGHGYGNPWGLKPLRKRIALMLAERGIQASTDQVLLTHGANHALDMVARQLLEPGDVALVDSPGYYPLFGKLRFSNVKLVGVRRLANGPDIDDLQEKAARYKPKVFFTQSLAHNPTGGSLTLPVAHRILKTAAQYGFYVVENDPFADILPTDSPRLAMLDQLERVIYIGTFSKTLSAGLRVGYLATSPALTAAFCDLKMLTLVTTSDFVERTVLGLIATGQYLKHLRRLKNHVERATQHALRTMESLGLNTPYAPGGGFYLWAELGAGQDELKLAAAAAKEQIFLAPGSLFLPDQESGRHQPALRINVAYADSPQFVAFMRNYLQKN